MCTQYEVWICEEYMGIVHVYIYIRTYILCMYACVYIYISITHYTLYIITHIHIQLYVYTLHSPPTHSDSWLP